MTSIVESPYTGEQISSWLRGLLTIAWADGDFDDREKELIAELTQTELAPKTDLGALEIITPEELKAGLGDNNHTIDNFLRTAVMVAIADGVYTQAEDAILREFCEALEHHPPVLESLRLTLQHPSEPSVSAAKPTAPAIAGSHIMGSHLDPLHPVKDWLDDLEIHDPRLARFLCKLIPSQCPFERDINLFGRKVVHIPPLCKLNPLYEQLVGLRFRALSYLADECGEDVTKYVEG